MLKQSIKYTDYNGTEREETFYFNLSRAELIDLEYKTPGGLRDLLERIVKEKDSVKIYQMFKDIVMLSYGEKSDDGKHFVKSPEISKAFTETEAFSELMMMFVSDAEFAAKFVNSVVPDKV